MGLLTRGDPLSWQETVPHIDYIKKHGIKQFIALYHRLKERQGDQLKWGDEIEYIIVKFDHVNRKVRVSLRADDLLRRLQAAEQVNSLVGTENRFLWRPEYAAYMIEGTPGVPYGGLLACFNVVENNMVRRRQEVGRLLNEDESVLSITFPLLGGPDFTDPAVPLSSRDPNSVARSLFFPDRAIYAGHIRFANLTRNIRGRRGEKVAINVPIFKDVHTSTPFVESFAHLDDDGEAARSSLPEHIYMDAMGFGMGCCCLQVTFQAVNLKEARCLYDELTPITPILLALSASTPIFRGFLADVDSRWNVISASVDDRTREERGLEPLVNQPFRLSKSRYDTTDTYLSECSTSYNDLALQYDEQLYRQLIDGGIDQLLARHIAHMFIRDPLQVYKDRIEQDDSKSTEHFETIQSSNWMNMRFKPPPPDCPEIGWRVEFRPTEVQLTDFENAAYCCFVVLLTRVIVSFRITFLLPLSKVDENMKRAQTRDAVLNGRFFFRKGLVTCNTPNNVCCSCSESDDLVEMTIDEIINGKGDDFPGLLPLVKQYLDSADVDVDTRCTVSQYMKFIQKRASGEIQTLAHWIREFVLVHPDYRQDSVVGQSIAYDLLVKMDRITKGQVHSEALLGCFRSKTDQLIPSAVRKAEESMLMNKATRKTTSKFHQNGRL